MEILCRLRLSLVMFCTLWVGLLQFAPSSVAESNPTVTSVEKSLIESDKEISGMFDDIARNLDSFLSGRSTPGLKNATKVTVENSTYSTEGNGVKNASHLNVDLRLPNLEEYLQLKFTTYDESEEERAVDNRYLRRTPRETNYGTSVGFFSRVGRIRTAFQPRIELRDPLRVSHSLKFTTEFDQKTYIFLPKLELFARPDKGTGVFTALNFHIPFTPIFALSLINDGEYEDRLNKFSTSNGVSLGQRLSDRTSMAYVVMFYANNRLTYHLEGWGLSAPFSHLLYKNVFHYQVVPHWDFEKIHGFKGAVGLALNLSLIF